MATDTASVISCSELEIGYNRRALLPPFSLTVAPADFWVVIGPNGSGKSTMMKTLLGLQRPLSGSVVRPPSVRIAYLQQRQQLDEIFPLRARDIVAGGALRGWRSINPFAAPSASEVRGALARTGMAEMQDAPFSSLSEGQKQRVLIAKGLISHPHVMFLDEPTSAMDATAEMEILTLLDTIRRESQMALLVITHFMEVAPRFATHVCFVDNICKTVLIGDAHSVYTAKSFVSHYGDHHHLLCGVHDDAPLPRQHHDHPQDEDAEEGRA